MIRKISIAILVLLAGLPFYLPAFAGGWAVVTLDDLSTQVMVGETIEVGFMLRGHGVTPITVDGLSVEASHQESGASISVPALPNGKEGHYLASFSLPEPGAWDWGISVGSYGFIQPMPTLEVRSSAPTRPLDPRPAFYSIAAALWTLAGLSILAGIVIFLYRKPARWAAILVVAGLAIGGSGFAISTAPARGTGSPTEQIGVPGQTAPAVLGADLFVAKGCVICHQHVDIPDRYVAFQTNVGPDLSNYSAASAFLQMWLSDPAEVKAQTSMPDLGLSETEIEALISFLNDES